MNLIASADRNWGIGCGGRLLLRIPEDMRFFREMTTGRVVVMGRKTRESIPGGILNERVNIVLTGRRDYAADGLFTVHSMKELRQKLIPYQTQDIFIIGGETLYRQMLDFCDTAYITKIDAGYPSDAYFPNLDLRPEWKAVEKSSVKQYDGIQYRFWKYRQECAKRTSAGFDSMM